MNGSSRRNRFRVSLVILSCIMAVGLVFGGSGICEAKAKYVLKVGHVFTSSHPWQKALEGMASDVAEATNGEVEIRVFPSSQLGGDRDMAEGLQMGSIEMALIGTGALQSLDKVMIVEELPYAWGKRENAYKALDGELGEILKDRMKSKGIIGLSFWASGYRHITNNVRPINTVDDLKGLKLRVPEAEMRIDTFKELGTLPTPLAFSEVFTALQQRVVDGQENPLATIYSSKFFEVQKYLCISRHIWGSAFLAISEKTWNNLPEEYRTIISDKAEVWKEKERQMIVDSEKSILEDLKAKGMVVTEPELGIFKEKVAPVWTKYESVFGKDIIDVVRKYSNL